MDYQERQALISDAVRKFEASNRNAIDYLVFLNVAHIAYDQGVALNGERLLEAIDYGLKPKKVMKKSGKNFRSGKLINTVKTVIFHPTKHRPAYIFEEDDDCVLVSDCTITF